MVGRLCLTEVADVGHWTQDFSAYFNQNEDKEVKQNENDNELKDGSVVTLKVLTASDEERELSLRPSRLVIKDKLFYLSSYQVTFVHRLQQRRNLH